MKKILKEVTLISEKLEEIIRTQGKLKKMFKTGKSFESETGKSWKVFKNSRNLEDDAFEYQESSSNCSELFGKLRINARKNVVSKIHRIPETRQTW